jgi:hypothetical protein
MKTCHKCRKPIEGVSIEQTVSRKIDSMGVFAYTAETVEFHPECFAKLPERVNK